MTTRNELARAAFYGSNDALMDRLYEMDGQLAVDTQPGDRLGMTLERAIGLMEGMSDQEYKDLVTLGVIPASIFTAAEQAQIDNMVARIQAGEMNRDLFVETTKQLTTTYKASLTPARQRELMARQIVEERTRPVSQPIPTVTNPTYKKEIVYDRDTHDWAMYLDGELVGFARTYHEAEITLDQLVFELMSGQYFVRTGEKAPPTSETIDIPSVLEVSGLIDPAADMGGEWEAEDPIILECVTCDKCGHIGRMIEDGEIFVCVNRHRCQTRLARFAPTPTPIEPPPNNEEGFCPSCGAIVGQPGLCADCRQVAPPIPFCGKCSVLGSCSDCAEATLDAIAAGLGTVEEVFRLALATSHIPLPDMERYTHPRIAGHMTCECASCCRVQRCFHNGETWICVDRETCETHTTPTHNQEVTRIVALALLQTGIDFCTVCGMAHRPTRCPQIGALLMRDAYVPNELTVLRSAHTTAVRDGFSTTAEALVSHAMCEAERYVRGGTQEPAPTCSFTGCTRPATTTCPLGMPVCEKCDRAGMERLKRAILGVV